MPKIEFSENKAKKELKEFKKNIKNDPEIVAAYLYGSYLTKNLKKESDIDICIIPKLKNTNVFKYNRDLIQISNYFKLPPNIQYHILNKGKEIYLPKENEFYVNKLKLKSIGEYEFYKKVILEKRKEVLLNG